MACPSEMRHGRRTVATRRAGWRLILGNTRIGQPLTAICAAGIALCIDGLAETDFGDITDAFEFT